MFLRKILPPSAGLKNKPSEYAGRIEWQLAWLTIQL
jgi:hypothetical protein